MLTLTSECIDGACYCLPGYYGDQPLTCYKSPTELKPQLLMPLWNSVPTRDGRGKCSNQLWKRTAEQGRGTVAFVDVDQADDLINDYYECLKMMFDAKVTIYLRVSGFDSR